MELITRLLQDENIEVTNLADEIKALGFNPDNINDKDALTVVSKLKAKYSKDKGTKNGKAGKLSNSVPVSPETSIEVATDKAVKQVDAMITKYQDMADTVATKKAEKIIGIIENIPNATMARVRQLLDDSDGNLDFFLNETSNLEQNFFSKFDIE